MRKNNIFSMRLSETAEIPGYGGRYRIDREGNVYNWKSGTKKVLKQHYQNGYRRVSLRVGDEPIWRCRVVARLMAESWMLYPDKLTVAEAKICYRDGNRDNIRVENLYLDLTKDHLRGNSDDNEYTVINKLKERVTGTRLEIRMKTGLTRQALSAMVNGKQIQSKGWFLLT